MKNVYLGICTLLISSTQLNAQLLDSMPFGNVKIQPGVYELNHQNLREIHLITGKVFPFAELPKKGKENFSGSVLTLFTGLHTGTAFESSWIFPNEIRLTGSTRWQVPFIVQGYYEKTRERVKNDDGSRSIESSERLTLHLEKGAGGWLIDKTDTLGVYSVTKRGEDPKGLAWKNYFGQNLEWVQWDNYFGLDLQWLREKILKYGTTETPTDFLIEGTLNGEDFLVVYSGQYYRAALIKNGLVVGIWQDTPYAIMLSKKHKINPYLLIPPNVAETVFHETVGILGLAHTISRNLIGN